MMISTQEASSLIYDRFNALNQLSEDDPKLLPIGQSLGRVLAENILSDRPMPPFNRAAMDGIALHHTGPVRIGDTWNIQGVQRAGEPPHDVKPSQCVEIMTGAACSANMVIPYEYLEIQRETKAILTRAIEAKPFLNIHQEGSDSRENQVIIPKGTKITSVEIGALASVGCHQAPVTKEIKVALCSTGDELVPIHASPKPWEIRVSNTPSIEASLKTLGMTCTVEHCLDNELQLEKAFGKLLDNHQVLIITGGVSKGKYDHVPNILKKLGVREVFHRIAQRPGKPMWFGETLSEKENKLVFGLPGNPVSAMVCFQRYIYPFLSMSEPDRLPLIEDFHFKKDMALFLPVKKEVVDDRTCVRPSPTNGSGDTRGLVGTHGFIELPAEKETFVSGEHYPFFSWD